MEARKPKEIRKTYDPTHQNRDSYIKSELDNIRAYLRTIDTPKGQQITRRVDNIMVEIDIFKKEATRATLMSRLEKAIEKLKDITSKIDIRENIRQKGSWAVVARRGMVRVNP